MNNIRVLWSPPSPLGDTIGYQISYTGDTNNTIMSVDVNDSSTNLLTGLLNGETYTISVVALSQDLPSNATVVQVTLGEKEVKMSRC